MKNIKPSDIDVNHWFMGSVFRSSECETILRNIVCLQRKHQKFTPFSWDDYKSFCTHSISADEKTILDSFVDGRYISYKISNAAGGGYLEMKGDKYVFTSKLIHYLYLQWPEKQPAII